MKKNLGQRLALARAKSGLTQDQVAEACGWGKRKGARISNYETGERSPDHDDADRIGKATDTSILYLLFGRGTVNDPYNSHENKVSKAPPPVDETRLEQCLAGVLDAQKLLGITLSVEQIGRLAAHVYAKSVVRHEEMPPEEITALVNLMR